MVSSNLDLKEEEKESITPSTESETQAKRRRIGVFMVAAGAFLCVFGFLITMFLLQHGFNFNLALYGTTGFGGSLLLGGMIAILG